MYHGIKMADLISFFLYLFFIQRNQYMKQAVEHVIIEMRRTKFDSNLICRFIRSMTYIYFWSMIHYFEIYVEKEISRILLFFEGNKLMTCQQFCLFINESGIYCLGCLGGHYAHARMWFMNILWFDFNFLFMKCY